jgi:uncharacterized protein DUF4242
MARYVILRRGAWRVPEEVRGALERARADGEQFSIGWLCSYVLAEYDGGFGTVCVYDAPSPEGVRAHAYRAGLPVDEIVALADTVVGDDTLIAAVGRRSLRQTGEGGLGCI